MLMVSISVVPNKVPQIKLTWSIFKKKKKKFVVTAVTFV